MKQSYGLIAIVYVATVCVCVCVAAPPGGDAGSGSGSGVGDASAQTSSVTVDFVGKSGKIKIFTTSDSNNFVMISQSKLAETTPSGNSASGQRSVTMASTQGTWGTPSSSTTGGVTKFSTSYSSNFDVAGSNVSFVLTAALYQEASTVPYGNDTIKVYANSVKFTVAVTGWPFAAAANTLNYEIQMSSKGGDGGANKGNSTGKSEQVVVTNGFMEMPTNAIIDGVSTPIGITLSTQGGKDTIAFAFPSFSNTLVYDPVIVVDGSSSPNSSPATASAGVALVLVAAAALAVMA